jgi:FAD/FMN-containing dehydrogenase/Fe-S oxidoreductase
MSADAAFDAAERLAFRLRRHVAGEVRFDPGSRHLYATDASNYRHLPLGVVTPRSVDDVAATVAACREAGVGVTSRGAGTSLAGQAANTGVILDTSRHLDRVLDLDPAGRLARVEPGVVLDDLQAAAAPHGLRFGPDPSTHDRCTLGGMIGNDACGVHSLTAGRTVHNVEELDLLLADGTRLTVGRHHLDDVARLVAASGRVGEVFAGLLRLREEAAPLVAERFPDIPRRVSGYHLDQLLHDDHLHVARALVGSEGTCVVVLGATVRLVERRAHQAVVVLAYGDLGSAADHVPSLLEHDLQGLEGLDDRLVAGAMRPGRPPSEGIDLLPEGRAWLLAEVGGHSVEEVEAAAAALAEAAGADGGPTARVVTDPGAQRALWKVRADGLGAITFVPGERPRLSGWEDAAVAPDRIGPYLRDLETLLAEHGLTAGMYGHFGDGCVHTKIDFDPTSASGRATFRAFCEQAADLVVTHGGSLSGEHGDGQARAELYERMFGVELVDAFRRFKGLWDPDGVLNPGRLVDPMPLDADLRLADREAMRTPSRWFALAEDDGDLAAAASRCVGMGLCRRDHGNGTMCPSWMVTHEERHSTRGRAHLLFELLHPETELDGWQDDAVADALDLCLSCKACKSDCPVDVDVATMKAEFLARRFEGRLRPLEHYALGLVRWWLRLGSHAPRTANAAARSGLGRWGMRRAGLAPERPAPALAPVPFSRWWRRRQRAAQRDRRQRAAQRDRRQRAAPAGPVLLFVDTFTETLTPEVGRAAVRVLEAAGFSVAVAPRPVCCGRPLFDHGMLDTARRQLTRLARTLGPAAHTGVPIVGLEPSCVASLRDELTEMLPHDPDATAVAAATRTLAELLVEVDWEPPHLDMEVLVHGHCHHEAVMGLSADRRLLEAARVTWRELDAGCCGLAGSFGFRAGEPYEVSVAAGERKLAPAVRAAAEDAVVLADGFSCRTQVEHLVPEGPRPRHLAELLAGGLPRRGAASRGTAPDARRKPSSTRP